MFVIEIPIVRYTVCYPIPTLGYVGFGLYSKDRIKRYYNLLLGSKKEEIILNPDIAC